MEKNRIFREVLLTFSKIIGIGCLVSTILITKFWIIVIEKDLLSLTPFPTKEIGILIAISVLDIVVLILYFKLCDALDEKK